MTTLVLSMMLSIPSQPLAKPAWIDPVPPNAIAKDATRTDRGDIRLLIEEPMRNNAILTISPTGKLLERRSLGKLEGEVILGDHPDTDLLQTYNSIQTISPDRKPPLIWKNRDWIDHAKISPNGHALVIHSRIPKYTRIYRRPFDAVPLKPIQITGSSDNSGFESTLEPIVDPNGKFFVEADGLPPYLSIRTIADGKAQSLCETKNVISAMAWSDDGKRLWVGTSGNLDEINKVSQNQSFKDYLDARIIPFFRDGAIIAVDPIDGKSQIVYRTASGVTSLSPTQDGSVWYTTFAIAPIPNDEVLPYRRNHAMIVEPSGERPDGECVRLSIVNGQAKVTARYKTPGGYSKVIADPNGAYVLMITQKHQARLVLLKK